MKINLAANVELVALDDAEIKYSTVQNWYQATKMVSEVFTILLQKRCVQRKRILKFKWTQVETGSAITEVP